MAAKTGLAFSFKKVDPAEIKSSLQGQARESQWRGLLDAFMETGEAAIEVELSGTNRKGDEYKPQSVSGALYAVMRTSAKAGNEYPVSVKVRGETIYLTRTDLNGDAEAATDAE